MERMEDSTVEKKSLKNRCRPYLNNFKKRNVQRDRSNCTMPSLSCIKPDLDANSFTFYEGQSKSSR